MTEAPAQTEMPHRIRADAQRNRDRILAVAETVIGEQGAQASLRDIARRAEVGLGTLYRHFPTRDALLADLLGDRFEQLAVRAAQLADGKLPAAEALREWLWEFSIGTSSYRGLPAALVDTLHDEQSPLHGACARLQQSTHVLLERAQQVGAVRADVDSADLFALAAAVGWVVDQSIPLAGRHQHLFTLMFDGLAAH
ncbi:TetR/AcrR family transcriptional regulator [Nocardia sp. CWNU-33]|uniref:TetR/AcrR family transcriptional regulator n=1 Tax=Nocardia sp. CWNU-33 TaxID=3392117 RepID=UPI00398E6489